MKKTLVALFTLASLSIGAQSFAACCSYSGYSSCPGPTYMVKPCCPAACPTQSCGCACPVAKPCCPLSQPCGCACPVQQPCCPARPLIAPCACPAAPCAPSCNDCCD